MWEAVDVDVANVDIDELAELEATVPFAVAKCVAEVLLARILLVVFTRVNDMEVELLRLTGTFDVLFGLPVAVTTTSPVGVKLNRVSLRVRVNSGASPSSGSRSMVDTVYPHRIWTDHTFLCSQRIIKIVTECIAILSQARRVPEVIQSHKGI